MDGKQDRYLLRQSHERLDHAAEEVEIVHERRSVERDEGEASRLDPEATPRLPLPRYWKVTEDRVDHRVAHEMHAPGIDSFAAEVLHRALTVREEESARMVRETSVRLLGHR